MRKDSPSQILRYSERVSWDVLGRLASAVPQLDFILSKRLGRTLLKNSQQIETDWVLHLLCCSCKLCWKKFSAAKAKMHKIFQFGKMRKHGKCNPQENNKKITNKLNRYLLKFCSWPLENFFLSFNCVFRCASISRLASEWAEFRTLNQF